MVVVTSRERRDCGIFSAPGVAEADMVDDRQAKKTYCSSVCQIRSTDVGWMTDIRI